MQNLASQFVHSKMKIRFGVFFSPLNKKKILIPEIFVCAFICRNFFLSLRQEIQPTMKTTIIVKVSVRIILYIHKEASKETAKQMNIFLRIFLSSKRHVEQMHNTMRTTFRSEHQRMKNKKQ
jgi:hypothetical protein